MWPHLHALVCSVLVEVRITCSVSRTYTQFISSKKVVSSVYEGYTPDCVQLNVLASRVVLAFVLCACVVSIAYKQCAQDRT
jgi:hypothetical protein